MFNNIHRKVLTIGLAVTSGAITLATIKAKTVNNEEINSEINLDTNQLKANNNSMNGLNLKTSESVINSCITRLSQWRQINGIPGLVVGVSLRGHTVWTYSEGFADIENGVKCNDRTVMRIASISKSMTSSLMAKMIERNDIDLDKPIAQYLTKDQFPDKYWDGKKVDITLRQLASHLGGIRHYKKDQKVDQNKENDKKSGSAVGYQLGEFSAPEYYLKDVFKSVMDSLNLFKDDPLVSKPGNQYNYTTFGYTLISAVIESQLKGEKFEKYLIKFLREELGLENTYLDQNDPIIYNRSHFYVKSGPNGRVINAPYVDNSYKWAGGGLLSDVYDLLKFGNIMLYSYKGGADGKPGFIKREIVDEMWTPAENTKSKRRFGGYGLGWVAIRDEQSDYAFSSQPLFENLFSHTGGAIGASSVILIEPKHELIVTIIANLQQVNGLSENTRLDWDRRWGGYGLGWGAIRDVRSKYAFCSEPLFATIVSHTGAAIGASSVIMVEPNNELIVTIITNLQNVSDIYNMALDITKQFTKRDTSSERLDQLLTQMQTNGH